MVAAVSADSPAESRALAERLGIGLPLYSDAEGAAARAYGVWDADDEIALPATFVIARGGRLVYRYVGTSKSDRPPVSEILTALESAKP